MLLDFAAEAASVEAADDPKLARLVRELAEIASEAEREGFTDDDVRDRRKVLVFSYFADTVDWIMGFLAHEIDQNPTLAAYRGRLAAAAGNRDGREAALLGFAPRTAEAPPGRDDDRYDLLISTDVLSEGLNLQQARHIINYDLPWNPMRLVQRHGRIDRIGSRYGEVYLRSFFPADELEELLGLEERLHRKITQAARTIGVGSILPGSETTDRTFTETLEEIERVRREDATFFEEAGESKGVLSGEEYRQALRASLDDPELARRLRDMAWGAGSGMVRKGAERGYVFCARVADHRQPQFRYVEWPTGTDEPVVFGETLACLAHAHPQQEHDTQRHLPDEALRGAYDAWAMAKDDIVARSNKASDPRALAPQVPKAMRDAAELIRAQPPSGWTQEQSDALLNKLEDAYPERIQREIRGAMRSSEDPVEQANAIAERVHLLGLEPSPPPKPLPPILDEDVHLICWLAIVPGTNNQRAGAADG